jgi:hypothetical protein
MQCKKSWEYQGKLYIIGFNSKGKSTTQKKHKHVEITYYVFKENDYLF